MICSVNSVFPCCFVSRSAQLFVYVAGVRAARPVTVRGGKNAEDQHKDTIAKEVRRGIAIGTI